MNPVIAMLIGVIVMMVLIIFTRMHAFPSLIISAILIGILSGVPLGESISTVTSGFGGTMASIGIVIGFGCIMGIFLEKSGAAKRMALTILKMVGVKRADVVLGLTGFVVSIPVFCDSGFVILSSLAKEFSRLTKKSMVGLGGILGMGLYITHFMVPPTPGPLAVVGTFQQEGLAVDLGMFIIYGLLLSIPLFIFSVFLFRWFGNKYPQFVVPSEIDRSKYTEAQLKVLDMIEAKTNAGKELENSDFEALLSTEKLPGAGISFTILLLPVVLILCNTIVGQIASLEGTMLASIVTFLGNPVIALFISLCLGAFVLAKDLPNKIVNDMMNLALKDAGPIICITAAGGALGAVVKATGAAQIMADGIVAIGIPGILVPLLIGCIMRFPQGSGTTAMITGSAIIAPMVLTLGINPYLAGLAVCLTAMCPSFLNDSYFHVVTNFSGMDIKTSLKTWTMGSIAVPVFGSIIICILSIFFH
ncbi:MULTISPECIES: GntP family permease [Oscillospiraceae]|uniref:GntP family gluconate:H+ symporter n=1 Tax=Harryflintia acetispora TaxID=1849041 RepID=A0A9X8UHU4_9FIRM|nr:MULTISPECIES: GntP family permease [Oscillospiraceae]RGB66770.1 GntP family permease [Harryflintia acetispora]TCL42396.1 GntP family gluconate:H+ symporter [Harryflintia acetispora]